MHNCTARPRSSHSGVNGSAMNHSSATYPRQLSVTELYTGGCHIIPKHNSAPVLPAPPVPLHLLDHHGTGQRENTSFVIRLMRQCLPSTLMLNCTLALARPQQTTTAALLVQLPSAIPPDTWRHFKHTHIARLAKHVLVSGRWWELPVAIRPELPRPGRTDLWRGASAPPTHARKRRCHLGPEIRAPALHAAQQAALAATRKLRKTLGGANTALGLPGARDRPRRSCSLRGVAFGGALEGLLGVGLHKSPKHLHVRTHPQVQQCAPATRYTDAHALLQQSMFTCVGGHHSRRMALVPTPGARGRECPRWHCGTMAHLAASYACRSEVPLRMTTRWCGPTHMMPAPAGVGCVQESIPRGWVCGRVEPRRRCPRL